RRWRTRTSAGRSPISVMCSWETSRVSRLTWIARKLLGTVGGRTLAVLLLLIILYQAWLTVTATSKVHDAVGSNPDERGRFAVDVVLGFPPERFHILQLQNYGRIRS